MIIKKLAPGLALAAAMLLVAAGLHLARDHGLLGGDSARRTSQILIGLMLAAYANLMPKQVAGAPRSPRAEARAQAALRVGGWAFFLAGLAYAGLWAFAPLPLADNASMAVVVAALALTLGHAIWAFAACRTPQAH